jgi:hypothetical protein
VSNLTPAQIIDTLTRIAKDIDEAMDVRKYTAELETAELYFEAEIADQQHRASITAIRALRDRLEVGRSLGPLVRLEWGQA